MLPWLRSIPSEARLLFVYLPYAGGTSADARSWASAFPEDVALCPVQLAGRESRFREKAATRMGEVALPLAEVLGALKQPYVLFGHSMGSWIGYETLRQIRRNQGRMPEMLMVSARRAPELPDLFAPMHQLGDDDLLETLQGRYGAIPPQVLAERGLLQMFLPGLRADLQLLETHIHRPEAPLPVPITALYGRKDESAPLWMMEPWSAHTSRSFAVHGFEGGHFYFREDRTAFMQVLAPMLDALG